MSEPEGTTQAADAPLWAKVIDHARCIGCHACTTACKSENEVPLSVTRTYVKYVDVGAFPQARRAFQVTRCNQCDDAPCVTACPTSAMFRRSDGIVDFDKAACIGCKACIAACPYDAIFINPEDRSAEKCNFCAHRLDVGLEPACVVVCPTEAILVGDMRDPSSKVARLIHREPVTVRRPEKETRPKLFYRGAHEATLDPLAARNPGGGLFMWSEQGNGRHHVPSGTPGAVDHTSSSAAAVLSYDVPHVAPWDWRVSLYTWTKSVAAGAYLVPLVLILFGAMSWTDPLWLWAAPVVAGAFLAATGGLLIWDLEHPSRFFYIFLRPQWRSWLVRGGVIIGLFGAVLAGHFLATWLEGGGAGGSGAAGGGDAAVGAGGMAGADAELGGAAASAGRVQRWLAVAGLPLSALTAVYTAYLFSQARARDLWQSPLLPPHLLVQAAMAGSGAMALVAARVEPGAVAPLLWTFTGSGLAHLLMVAGEVTLTHGTAHARRATREMVRGRYAGFFWVGIVLVAVGLPAPAAEAWLAAPLLAPWLAVPGLAGLLCFEHAYVQAGQSVPLA